MKMAIKTAAIYVSLPESVNDFKEVSESWLNANVAPSDWYEWDDTKWFAWQDEFGNSFLMEEYPDADTGEPICMWAYAVQDVIYAASWSEMINTWSIEECFDGMIASLKRQARNGEFKIAEPHLDWQVVPGENGLYEYECEYAPGCGFTFFMQEPAYAGGKYVLDIEETYWDIDKEAYETYTLVEAEEFDSQFELEDEVREYF